LRPFPLAPLSPCAFFPLRLPPPPPFYYNHFCYFNHFSLCRYRGQIYQISRCDALRRPVMYQLKDLLGDPVKGRYYKEQLRKAPTPGHDFQLEVK
jgi:hypothetical protein